MINYISYLIFFSLIIPFSMIQSLSFGYEDNFMRFSDLDMISYYNETNTVNDYFGDSKYYDSAIISPSIQVTFNSKINKYKTNLIIKSKFSEYVSSNLKSFAYFSARFELKLKSYNWIKFSYSLVPKYYLRTFIDRDMLPLTYYPCDFSNENAYVSYSFPIKKIKKTWLDIKLNLNNQFYNEHFTEYDTRILSLEGNIKSLFFKQYFLSIGSFYAMADNISYDKYSSLFQSTRIDRSYIKKGLKVNLKRTFKKSFISDLSIKFKFNTRYYDMDSWYYEFDNWRKYSEVDLVLESSKKINKNVTAQISGRYFIRDVISSQSSEALWIEDFKPYNRNELWLRFIYKFSHK
tara:strand:+ start:320 stop:1363 length:1044 start_codon:yes stop_codon:yes gene_type:complete